MLHLLARWSQSVQASAARCLISLIICAPTLGFGQAPDEAAVRALVNNFFVAYQNGNIDYVASFLDAKSPKFAGTKQQLQKVFTENEKIEITGLAIRKLTLDGANGAARVTVEMSAVDRKTKSAAAGFGKMDFTLRVIKEDGAWKVRQFMSSADDLASALAAAQTEQERTALLAANNDLVTVELGQAIAAQASALLNARKYQEAFIIFQLASRISEQTGDKAGVLIGWRGMGIAQYYQGNFSQSSEYLLKSLRLAEELGDKRKISNLLTNLGILYQDQGETEKALASYQKSLATAEALGAKDLTASALMNIGTVYRTRGEYARALEAYGKSVELRKELGDKGLAAIGLNRIGLVNFEQGNYAQALEYFQNYLVTAEELADKVYMNSALFNIGMVYSGQRNYARSLENYQKALSIKEQLGDKNGITNTLNAIGTVYEGQGDYAKALEYYRKSMALSEPLGYKPLFAVALQNSGEVYLAQGEYAKALETFQRSLKLEEEMGDKGAIADALVAIGLLHRKQGDYAQALDYSQRGLSIAESIGGKDRVGSTLHSISDIYYDQGSYTKSIESADRAAAIAKLVGNPETLWQARTTAGNAYRALNQPGLARQAFDEAIASIETVRSSITGGEQQQEQFFEDKVSPYQGMIALLVSQHKDAEALSYAERAKARVLLDVLRSGKVDVAKAMTAEEQNQERTMRNELTSFNTQIERESARPQPDAAVLESLKGRLRNARLEYDTFQTNLYASHPDLKVQRGDARPVTPEAVGALISDGSTALLEFVVTDDKTYLFVNTKNGRMNQSSSDLKTYVLDVKRKDLIDRAALFRSQLARRDLRFGELARQLFDLLIEPAQPQIEGKTNLLIVPDGALWELPFQALQSPQGRFLLEEHAISYVPSASVLQEMVRMRRKRTGNFRSASLLAFGNPALGKQTTERVGLTRGEAKLQPLPETEREVKHLSELYGSTQSHVFIGEGASEDRLKAEAPKFTILHLATHGILNDASPMYSQVVLSQGDASANEDGLLEAWEIMKMDLKADLVVLSACETARGRVGEGEGIIGLTWALFVAGSPTNVVSQWKVDSISTTQLMLEFHRNLKNELIKGKSELGAAKALQQAAIALLRTKEYRHPFYWAGFVVMGAGF